MALVLIWGIDPGLSGGISMMNTEKKITAKIMPTITIKKGKKNKRVLDHKGLKETFEPYKSTSCYAVIEKQHAMPGQGVSSMLTIGIGYGSLLQTIVDFEIPFEEVRAQVWQKTFGIANGDTKAQALNVCQDLFPNLNLLATKRSRKAHSGIVDAVLLMEYGIRKYKNEIQ